MPTWTRAFLAVGTVFLVSSTFTLAKCVRDHQETESVVSRLDAARIDRLLAEFDPYRMPGADAGQQSDPHASQPPFKGNPGQPTGPAAASPTQAEHHPIDIPVPVPARSCGPGRCRFP